MFIVEFKPNTSVYPKCMVLSNVITKQEAWDRAVKDYGESVDKVYKSNELDREVDLIKYGTEVIYNKIIDPNTNATGKPKIETQKYPIINLNK